MNKKLTILVLVFLTGATVCAGRRARRRPIADGFALAGIDGKVVAYKNGKYFFQFDRALGSGKEKLAAGASCEFLPSSALQRLANDSADRLDANYRLWGTITKYKGRNFIFLRSFLPLSKARDTKPQRPETADSNETVTINEPNDELSIPPEILAKLKDKQIVGRGPKNRKKDQAVKPNFVLVNRYVILSQQGKETIVTLEGLGQNIAKESFRLLACEVTEQVERQQKTEPDKIRLKVTGIVTEYKGRKYLLPQRATRAYSNQNFDL
ncbi:MAG: hypothetical protein ACYST9_00665 [Planctomycetota bacterium]|jgi:hypothetical protein